MNKLIIVGNGFDIYNGLATRYSDFLKWYITSCFDKAFEKLNSIGINSDGSFITIDNLIEIKINKFYDFNDPKPIKEIKEFTEWYCSKKTVPIAKQRFSYAGMIIGFEIKVISDLLRQLIDGQVEKNWVDVEMTYYNLLKRCLLKYKQAIDITNFSENDLIKTNSELQIIKEKLEEYLLIINKNHKVSYDFDYCADGPIDIKFIIDKHHHNKLEDNDYEDARVKKFIIPKDVTFLNFNYTGLTYNLRRRHYNHINIHGTLNDDSNNPIFGFGDEIDTDYHEMEKTNINSFLTHIKSFGYFKNSNYHDLINFLESDSYVVYIWGHSCGLTDRTLLSMIFEHDNCAAIKPYYWEKENGITNYVEITQNISRHFKNKLKMRNRVVNFEFCSKLGSQH